MIVKTRLAMNGNMRCYADTLKLGVVVVGEARNEFAAQYKAARFLDTNFPDESIEWEGGYHGGGTSSGSANVQATYFGPQ